MVMELLSDVVGISGLDDVPEVVALGDAACEQASRGPALIKGIKAHIQSIKIS